MRGRGRDSPEWDAELFISDGRPVIGTCCVCGNDIYGEDSANYADDAYFVDGEMFHEECSREWLSQFKV